MAYTNDRSLDQLSGKPCNIALTFSQKQYYFGVYGLEDAITIYQGLPLDLRFSFGVDILLVSAHGHLLDFTGQEETKIAISVDALQGALFSLMHEDSIKYDNYPNFIQFCVLSDKFSLEIIQGKNNQTGSLQYVKGAWTEPTRQVENATDAVITLMKEFAASYTSNEVDNKIKFWKSNLAYTKQVIKSKLKDLIALSIEAELDLLEEFRKGRVREQDQATATAENGLTEPSLFELLATLLRRAQQHPLIKQIANTITYEQLVSGVEAVLKQKGSDIERLAEIEIIFEDSKETSGAGEVESKFFSYLHNRQRYYRKVIELNKHYPLHVPFNAPNEQLYLVEGIEWFGTTESLTDTHSFLMKFAEIREGKFYWKVQNAAKCNAVFLFDQLKKLSIIPQNLKDVTILGKLVFVEKSGNGATMKPSNWSAHRHKMSIDVPYYTPATEFIQFIATLKAKVMNS